MGPIESLILDISLLVVGAIALGVAAGYVASAAARVTQVDDWKKDDDLSSAHTYLSWSATFGWIGLAGLITLIVLYVIFGSESIEFTIGLVSKGLLFLAIGILILTGSFAAVGASYIDRSPKSDDAKKNGAYRQAIIAAVLAIVGGAAIIGLFLYLMFHKPKSKEDKEKEQEKKDIDDLKSRLLKEREAEIEEKTAIAKSKAKKATT